MGFGHFDVWKMIKRTMKIEIAQIKRGKLEQSNNNDTIGLTLRRVGFFSFLKFRVLSQNNTFEKQNTNLICF